MELKTIALKLGLPETAEESAVLAKVGELQAAAADVARLKKEKEDLTLAQVTAAVETAIKENRLTADRKEHFINLGKTIGIDSLRMTLEAISPAARLSKTINRSGDSPATWQKTCSKLSEVPEAELKEIREKDTAEYRRLFKAEYGFDCNV